MQVLRSPAQMQSADGTVGESRISNPAKTGPRFAAVADAQPADLAMLGASCTDEAHLLAAVL